jgi:uncharacterized membrane protein YccC
MASSGTFVSGPNQASKIWIGIAVGAAVGIGVALSRRRRTRWEMARELVTDRSGDMAEAAKGIAARVKTIYEETRKVVEDAGDLWSQGRRLVRR